MRLSPLIAFFLLACWNGSEPAVYELVPVGPIVLGDSRQIYLTGAAQPQASERLRWESSDPNVAEVSRTGTVRGLKPGKVTVSVQDDYGKGSATVQVSTAGLRWSTPLPAARRTFLAVSESGWVFAKGVTDETCDWHCPGVVYALDTDGHRARSLPDVGTMIAGDKALWFERDGIIGRWEFLTGREHRLTSGDRLLGRFREGDLLIARGQTVLRIDEQGGEKGRWTLDTPVERALILDNNRFVVSAGDGVTVVSDHDRTHHGMDWPVLPWAATRDGAFVLSDRAGFGFWLVDGDSQRSLAGRYSVLVGPDRELVESEGLSASLSVPVETQEDGSGIFLKLNTYGGLGGDSYMDVVFRQGEDEHWRWGPSTCADHPFAVVVGLGYALLSDCDRLVRIDDQTIQPSGAWPQPGADGARTWRIQR